MSTGSSSKPNSQHSAISPTNFLAEVAQLVEGDRQRDYDHPSVNFGRIAQMWSIYLKKKVTSRDVAWLMVLMKVARDMGTPKRDNLLDAAGYVYCADIIEEDTVTVRLGETITLS